MVLHHTSSLLSNTSYVLTQKGRELAPSIVALTEWGDRWGLHDDPSIRYVHRDCGGAIQQQFVCNACFEIPELDEMESLSRRSTHSDALSTSLLSESFIDQLEPVQIKIEISLLGAFALKIGGETVARLSMGTQRVLAYLALHDRAVTRISMAGTMWPEVSDQSAGGSLRSALSRLNIPTRDAIIMASTGLRLATYVVVDLRESQELARRLVQGRDNLKDSDLDPSALAALSLDLLPDWYDDWVVGEAEAWRQTRISALDALGEILAEKGRWAEALEAAQAALKVDPLRESAHSALIRVHLAEGNQSEALRSFERYRVALKAELGLEPTSRILELVRTLF
jgi:DNA-binding SARP family transcriptional activator